jgi:hypothetical protein
VSIPVKDAVAKQKLTDIGVDKRIRESMGAKILLIINIFPTIGNSVTAKSTEIKSYQQ